MNTPDLRKYQRILLLTDGYSTPFLAKTAISMLRYRTADVVGVLDQEHAGKTTQSVFAAGGDLPIVGQLSDVTPDALFIGIAPPGGELPKAWYPIIQNAIEQKIDVVSGLHDFLTQNEAFVDSANRSGAQLIDVRCNDERDVATCATFRRQCVRIHAVGNDCSLGKMVTSLELQRGLLERGLDAGFAATGQTGIMIAGTGIPIDCVVADFVNGAAEKLVLANESHDFLLIEGQGSISHPLYSAVTVGLLHGSAPDGLVFCYEAGRKFVKGIDGVPIPPMKLLFDTYHQMANLRHPCKIIGVAANTRTLSAEEAQQNMQEVESELGVPVCDVYRDGGKKLIDAVVSLRRDILGG